MPRTPMDNKAKQGRESWLKLQTETGEDCVGLMEERRFSGGVSVTIEKEYSMSRKLKVGWRNVEYK